MLPDPTPWECNVFADEPLYLERELQPLRTFLDELEPSEYDVIHHKELHKMYRLYVAEPVIKENDFKDILSKEKHISYDGYIKGFKLKPHAVNRYQQKTKEWIEKNMGWGNYIRSLTTATS